MTTLPLLSYRIKYEEMILNKIIEKKNLLIFSYLILLLKFIIVYIIYIYQ